MYYRGLRQTEMYLGQSELLVHGRLEELSRTLNVEPCMHSMLQIHDMV